MILAYNVEMKAQSRSKIAARQPEIKSSRLETFSDGFLAIIITIMVLELRAPSGHEIITWKHAIPSIFAYILSFVFIAIYWNNHHHLLRATKQISAGVMWANMHLLFWLSLVPLITSWIGEGNNYMYTWPVVLYGVVAIMAGIAYSILAISIKKVNPHDPALERIDKDIKGILSIVLYAIGIIFALFHAPVIGIILFIAVSIMWLIPDRRLA